MANNTAKSVTLKDKNTGDYLYPYTSDSLVKRTNSTYETVKEALDALEAGGAATNRAYDSTKNVQGYMVLNPGTSSASVASQLQGKDNYIIEIRDIIDLNDTTLTIPEGCTLKFVGGKITNGTLVGTDTVIDADPVEIFGDDVIIGGTWDTEGYAEWFDDDIQKTLNAFKSVELLADKKYEVTDTITFPFKGDIHGNGYSSVLYSKGGVLPVIDLGWHTSLSDLSICTDLPCDVIKIQTENWKSTYLNVDKTDFALSGYTTVKNVNIRSIGIKGIKNRVDDYNLRSTLESEYGSRFVYGNNAFGRAISILSDGKQSSESTTLTDISSVTFDNISIAGGWKFGIYLDNGNNSNSITSDNSISDIYFNHITFRYVESGIYIGKNSNSLTTDRTTPITTGFSVGRIIFNDCSMQFAGRSDNPKTSLYQSVLDKAEKIYFNNYLGWDWTTYNMTNKEGKNGLIRHKINRDYCTEIKFIECNSGTDDDGIWLTGNTNSNPVIFERTGAELYHLSLIDGDGALVSLSSGSLKDYFDPTTNSTLTTTLLRTLPNGLYRIKPSDFSYFKLDSNKLVAATNTIFYLKKSSIGVHTFIEVLALEAQTPMYVFAAFHRTEDRNITVDDWTYLSQGGSSGSNNNPYLTKTSYNAQYLTFTAIEGGTFTFTGNDLQYSLDNGETWTTLTSGTASPSVSANDTIMWKATGLTVSDSVGIGTFSSTGTFNASGNLLSLVYGDDFADFHSIGGYQFLNLFKDNTNITNTKNLRLPINTASYYCCKDMFSGCTSLTTSIPVLPATTLGTTCYQNMYKGCTSLTTAPELPATVLSTKCYAGMFSGCTALEKAPKLPAPILTENCYAQIFKDCSSLDFVECLCIDRTANQCLSNWLASAGTGILVCIDKTIPASGWTPYTREELLIKAATATQPATT